MDGFIGSPGVEAPDLTEVVLGVRGFLRDGHYLSSPFQNDVWRRPTMTAVCEPDRAATAAALRGTGVKPGKATSAAQRIVEQQQARPDHEAPGDHCHCGLYAYHTMNDLGRHQRVHPIVAAVHAWGPMWVYPHGFRAQHMRIVALALPADLPDNVAGARLAEVARRAAAWWRLPLLSTDALGASLPEFGDPIPATKIPDQKEEKE